MALLPPALLFHLIVDRENQCPRQLSDLVQRLLAHRHSSQLWEEGRSMGFDHYHEPPAELPAERRTFARVIASLTEEAEEGA